MKKLFGLLPNMRGQRNRVAAYARKNGLQLVLQLPGRKMGAASGVIFAADALDITSAIMKQMGIDPPPPEQDDAVQVPAVQN